MTAPSAVDVGLAVLLMGLAGWSVAARSAASAVVGFVGFGTMLALGWMRLGAPDVALTEGAMGAGLTGVVLLRAAARERDAPRSADAERGAIGPAGRAVSAALATVVALGLGALVLNLPEPPPSLAPAAVAELGATGLGNAVNGVLLAFRAIDTLLEMVVLLVALLAVWSLAPDAAWTGRPQPPRAAVGPVVLLARVLPPAGLVIGFFLSWNGADEPGGAFPGGTVLAAMWLLTVWAGLARLPRTNSVPMRAVLVAGPGVFMLVGLAGFVIAAGFLAYPAGSAKPFIVAIEVALTISIAATLALLVAGPPADGAER